MGLFPHIGPKLPVLRLVISNFAPSISSFSSTSLLVSSKVDLYVFSQSLHKCFSQCSFKLGSVHYSGGLGPT